MDHTINSLYQNIGDELALGSLTLVDVIQPLWGGYGKLVRLRFQRRSVIVKHVRLSSTSEHPKGWNTDLSHLRKLHSYQVEVSWYQHFTTTIDERCRVPQGLKCVQTENEWLIVMEDLIDSGYPTVVKSATQQHLKACLVWLANFHARYIGTTGNQLWQTGTYWHLETRPDEFVALADQRLKQYAKRIDLLLKNAKYQTLVHGDAKLANFCFNPQMAVVAAVDFQYVGHGCAMKDVALFMSSAVEPDDCAKMEEWVLDTYFIALAKALKCYQPRLNVEEVELEWRPMFALAWADFQRFVKGWSPDHWKINAYTEALTERALTYLDSQTVD
ncbi:phosphotransferase [Vibrio alfacsensis]|uniref:phosphotransferase n=1 Tax=Vibrio alfacsensis TaxID=1074311 RepID=UPI004068BC98